MSVEEQPIGNRNEVCPPADIESSESISTKPPERRHAARDTVVAGSILLVSALAVVLYFNLSKKKSEVSNPSPASISATSWLGAAAKEDAPTTPSVADTDSTVSAAHPNETGYAPEPEPAVRTESEDVSASRDKNTRHGTVKSGVPVIASLQQLGLSLQQAHAVISALDGVFDFRKAHPGESFDLRVDESGGPLYFRYDVSLTEVYEVEKKGDGLKGKRKHIPTTKKSRQFGGTIASSLYKSLSDLGADPSLAGRIVEVLANEVNFYKEQRPGDTFRVVVEEESLNGTFLGFGPVLALEYQGVKSGKKRFFLFDADGRESEYFNEKGISQPRSVIAVPLHYTKISSTFGLRFHPVLKRKMLHNGVDFAAFTGEPVWACQEGIVTLAAKKGANGNLVAIRHADALDSFYAHLYRFASGIKPGVTVKRRQVIGYVGNTGRSTGPHLHFGLKKGGKFIDPLKYKVQPGRRIEADYRKSLDEIIQTRSRLLDRTPITPASEPLANTPEAGNDVLGVEDW